jgi:hypothetical protein
VGDCRLTYTYQSTIYAGKPVGKPSEHYRKGVQDNVVKLLANLGALQDISGRNITFDRFVGLGFS